MDGIAKKLRSVESKVKKDILYKTEKQVLFE